MSRLVVVVALLSLVACQNPGTDVEVAVPQWLQQAQVQYPLTVEVLVFDNSLQVELMNDPTLLAPLDGPQRRAILDVISEDNPAGGGTVFTTAERDQLVSGPLPDCGVVAQTGGSFAGRLYLACQSVTLASASDTATVRFDDLIMGPRWTFAITWKETRQAQSVALLRLIDRVDSIAVETGSVNRDLTSSDAFCFNDYTIGTSFDDDGDGIGNLEEIAAGRDPLAGWSTVAGGSREVMSGTTQIAGQETFAFVALPNGVLLSELETDVFQNATHTISYFTTDLSTPVWTKTIAGMVVADESTGRVVAMEYTNVLPLGPTDPIEGRFLDVDVTTGAETPFGAFSYSGDDIPTRSLFIDETAASPGVWLLVASNSAQRFEKFAFAGGAAVDLGFPFTGAPCAPTNTFVPGGGLETYELATNRDFAALGDDTRLITLLLRGECVPLSIVAGADAAAVLRFDEAGTTCMSCPEFAFAFDQIVPSPDAESVRKPWVDPTTGNGYAMQRITNAASRLQARLLNGNDPWGGEIDLSGVRVATPAPLGTSIVLQETSATRSGMAILNPTTGDRSDAATLLGRQHLRGFPCGDDAVAGGGPDWGPQAFEHGGGRVVLSASHPEFRDSLRRSLLVLDDSYQIVADAGRGLVPCLSDDPNLMQAYDSCDGQVGLGGDALFFVGVEPVYDELRPDNLLPGMTGFTYRLHRVALP